MFGWSGGLKIICWMDRSVFRWLVVKIGSSFPQVDIFAMRLNALVDFWLDVELDVFFRLVGRVFFWANLPFSMLVSVFAEIVRDSACCLFLVLCWRGDQLALCLGFCMASVLYLFFSRKGGVACLPPPLELLGVSVRFPAFFGFTSVAS